LVLEGLGYLKALTNAQKQRPSIIGQVLIDMTPQRCEIKPLVHGERCHAGASVIPRDLNAVYTHLDDTRAGGDRLRDLGSSHILALPAKRFTDAIDKVIKTARVLAHEIATAHPGVAQREDISQNFLLRIRAVQIALEIHTPISRIGFNLGDRLAHLIRLARNTMPFIVTQRFPAFEIIFDDRHFKAMRNEGRHAPYSARFTLDVIERKVALRSCIEFQYARNGEALLETLPYIRPKPIAYTKPQAMFPFFGAGWRVHEVAA